jgi:hypothetical protein
LRNGRFWLGYNLRLAAFSQTLPAFSKKQGVAVRIVDLKALEGDSHEVSTQTDDVPDSNSATNNARLGGTPSGMTFRIGSSAESNSRMRSRCFAFWGLHLRLPERNAA